MFCEFFVTANGVMHVRNILCVDEMNKQQHIGTLIWFSPYESNQSICLRVWIKS